MENSNIMCNRRNVRRLYWSKIIKKTTNQNIKNSIYDIFNLCIIQNVEIIHKKIIHKNK